MTSPVSGSDSMTNDTRLLWFATFVTHNSRVSERMVTYGVHSGAPLIFSSDEQVEIATHIIDVCHRHHIAICALNVLPDHVHMVLAARDSAELTDFIRKIKGYSAYAFHRGADTGNGLKPVVETTERPDSFNNGLQPIAQSPVWAQKSHWTPITNSDQLENILYYVRTNHEKHVERWGEGLMDTWDNGLKPIVEAACVSPEQAANGK